MSDTVPFVDLKLNYLLHREKFDRAMLEVCEAGSYILGPQVSRFEKNFAAFIGSAEAIGVATGTDALCLSCRALGIGPGDEVLIPANTFIATALAVSELGARVVPVDCDPDSFLIDLDQARTKLTARTKAIIPVHLYGQCLDMDRVIAFASENGLLLVEDACQSHGARWAGRCSGSFGAAGCYSFYPAKNLGGFGDGGMIVTDDRGLADRLRLLRNYGSVKKYIHESIGLNSRLDSLQAAVLDTKLPLLNSWNRARFEAALRYAKGLEGVPGVKAPVFDHNAPESHVFHLFVIQCERRDELGEHLSRSGIQWGIHYPVPIHLHKAYSDLGLGEGSYPVAERLAGRILSLPMFPEITPEQVDRVTAAVREFYKA
ncbi:DegT/DnrJ/EryC1/StrS family aminotransferase [bacterium]|nr:DegT/DnrJ/EryC1/StrS family aminotransferase [bacterium]